MTNAKNWLAPVIQIMKKATEVINRLRKHLHREEATKAKPSKKWYSVSLDGVIKPPENVEKVGEPVINLSRKVLSLLTREVIP